MEARKFLEGLYALAAHGDDDHKKWLHELLLSKQDELAELLAKAYNRGYDRACEQH